MITYFESPTFFPESLLTYIVKLYMFTVDKIITIVNVYLGRHESRNSWIYNPSGDLKVSFIDKQWNASGE